MKFKKISHFKSDQQKIHILITGLYIGRGAFGGVVNFTLDYLKNINKNIFLYDYFSYGKSPKWCKDNTQPTFFTYFLDLLIAVFRFPYLVHIKKIDIVHINAGLTSFSLVRDGVFSVLAKLMGCKVLFMLHGWKDHEYIKLIENPLKRITLLKFFNNQDIIGVGSKKNKNKLVELGLVENKIFLFTNMVETQNFANNKNVHGTKINILFCAHPVRTEKGINEFIESIPIIINQYPGCKFIVLGGGEHLEKYIKKADTLDIKSCIEFTGFVSKSEKFRIFKKCHILVFPSYTEGFPKTVLEAMAAGMAIVTTPVGGLANAIVPEKNGLFIKSMPPKYEEIASHVCKILDDTKYFNDMMENNKNDAIEKYEAKIVVEKIENKYFEIF